MIVYLLNKVAPNDKCSHLRHDWSQIEELLGKLDLKKCFDCVKPQYDQEGDRNYFWEKEVADSICANMGLAISQRRQRKQDSMREMFLLKLRKFYMMTTINTKKEVTQHPQLAPSDRLL